MSAIPVPYIGTGNQSQTVLGHYGVAQKSGALTGTIAAAAALGDFRWAPTTGPSTTFAVLMRIRFGAAVTTAIQAASVVDIGGTIQRGFSVDFSANNTQATLAAPGITNSMRSNMGTSLLGTKGPQIATTAAMTGSTATADANIFCFGVLSFPTTAGAGTAGQITIYEWTALGAHPLVMSNNMGVVLAPVTATSFGTGVVPYYFGWEWGEVLAF